MGVEPSVFFKGAAALSRRPKKNARQFFLQLANIFITFADENINKII